MVVQSTACVPSEQLVVVEAGARDGQWEAFVAEHPGALIYHHHLWLETLEREYGCSAVRLLCEDAEGRVRGILALFPTRGLPFVRPRQLFGRRLASLPRTPVAGPLALDDEARVALLHAAIERVRAQPGVRLQLKTMSAELDGVVDGLVGGPWRVSYALRLPDNPNALRFGNSRNHNRIKWAVNKATKAGVQVRPAQTEDELRAWYVLYLDTMRWHALPARSYRFFKAAWDHLRPQGLMRLLLAERRTDRQPTLLAGSIFLMFGQTVFYAFNGRRKEALSLRPNDVLQWQAIHDACQAGFRYFDFGEVADNNDGLASFKSKWSAEPSELYRYYYPASSSMQWGALNTGWAHQVARTAWRRMPLQVTALLGDWIYSYL